jgi:hypothetical protein
MVQCPPEEVKMLDSRKILEETGIVSAKTLTRWYQRGLIPRPKIGTHPNGRGKIAFWDDWVLERCLRIKQLVQSGESLDSIGEMLGSDWPEAERTWRRRYRFAEVSRKLDFDAAVTNFADLTHRKLVALLDVGRRKDSPGLNKLNEWLWSKETIGKVLEFVRQGIQPVLVFDGERAEITADFMVSQMLSTKKDDSTPLIVVPLFSEVVKAFASVMPDLPLGPSITPVTRVRQDDAGKTHERDFRPVGLTDFEILHRLRKDPKTKT